MAIFATLRGTNRVYAKAVVFVKTSLVKGRGTALVRWRDSKLLFPLAVPDIGCGE